MAHNGEITSLSVGEFDEYFLVSTGADNRVKVWQKGQLMADFNVNVPYLICSYLSPTCGK